MSIPRGFILLCCAFGCLLVSTCGVQSLTGGTSTSEDARVAGVVRDREGNPVAGAAVLLRPSEYTADTTGMKLGLRTLSRRDTVTDENGAFSIDSVDPGSYCIEVNDGAAQAVLLTCDVTDDDTLVRIPDDTLHPTGAIQVSIVSAADPSVALYIQVPGLERIGRRDPETGNCIIDDLPQGEYALRLLAATPEYQLVKFDSATVASGETTDIGIIDVAQVQRWPYSQRIVLNTTVSGAGITESVTDFPVLVRLNDSNFDFTTANENGGDIRFAKADGTPLAFQIERWDATADEAEVWVLIDTIHGNDSTQFITMYWGNTEAVSQSDGPAVFATDAGFAGVWHLGESGGILQDATLNGFNGSGNGDLARQEGVIGYGQYLEGTGGYIEMGDVCDPGQSNFSVGLWVKRARTDVRATIISKSAGGSASSSYGWLVELDPDGAMILFMASESSTWGDTGTFVLATENWIADTLWHHVAVVIDHAGADASRLYIDGEDTSLLPSGGPLSEVGIVTNNAPLRFGADANGGNPWNGSFDECSISSVARSADWVRLCFMNQQSDDRLLVLREPHM